MLFSCTCFRMLKIAKENVNAAYTPSVKSIEIAETRGTIYDCKMRKLTNSEYEYTVIAKPTARAAEELSLVLDRQTLDAARERMSKGSPIAYKTENPITNGEDIMTLATPKRYSQNRLACHVIGYLDSSGHGISGVEKSYDTLLETGVSTVRAYFTAAANGEMLLGCTMEPRISGNSDIGVALTLDRDIQRITENALDNSGAVKACAIVIEIESGAVRAMVSRPSFDADNIAESLNDENSPLINRALLPFSVGSVFKPVVAAAALESDISEDFEYECTGSAEYSGVIFNCHKKDGHGVLDMCSATANSCNTYFAALAMRVGRDKIIETAEKFGFGSEILLAEGIKSHGGYLPDASELDSKAAIANISFGQGALTATPLQICNMMATIASGGIHTVPYLVEGEVNGDGELIRAAHYSERKRIISESTAKTLSRFLTQVVESGSGRRAASEAVTAAGKTATAQTGKSDENGEIYNAWFAGYFPAENPKYAVAVLKEDGGEGAVSCAPVFKEISEEIIELEK